MAKLNVTGGVSIDLLQNGDQLNTTLNATQPLYQTFKKGTQDFSPNWATASNKPVIFPRVYSVQEAKELVPKNIVWKYNSALMAFGTDGVCTSPEIPAGKVKKITHNGMEALQMIGNVASETNNDSDVVTFEGDVDASGQTIRTTADITILVEEVTGSLYRMFLVTADDVINTEEESISLRAMMYSSGVLMTTGVEFEFTDITGKVLKAKGTSDTLALTSAMIDSELMVVCKGYVGGVVVAQEQRQVWDAVDPFTVVCDAGNQVKQSAIADVTYTFRLQNARTGNIVPNIPFVINVYKKQTSADITTEFTPSASAVLVSGAKIKEHKGIYVLAKCTVDA